MSAWFIVILGIVAFSVAALLFYIRRSARAGDRVLVAHGFILLVGLVLAGGGVVALKLFGV